MRTPNKVDLHLRVNPKLKEFLVQQAELNDQTLNTFCICILKNTNLVKATILKSKAEKASLKLFSSMSNNINQLARRCNTEDNSATEEQLRMILEQAQVMKKEIIDELLHKGVVIHGNL